MDIDAMKTTKITMTKLTAADGMILTNGESYGKTIYLGMNDSKDNWREITEAEYEKLTAGDEVDDADLP